MKLPSFLKQKDDSLIYAEDGEFLFYVPEDYFTDVKDPIAQVVGQYVSTIGILDWALVSTNGTVSDAHLFKYPTIFLCKPNHIEKVKNLSLNKLKPKDYRILHFKEGDDVVSDIHTPQVIDNVEILFKMLIITGNKIPPTVPYDKMQEYLTESIELNGESYGLNMQMFGILVSELCRDSKELSKPFRYSDMKNMNAYTQISIKNIPKYISPYIALTSENLDESLMASILLSQQPEEEIKYTPLEQILTK